MIGYKMQKSQFQPKLEQNQVSQHYSTGEFSVRSPLPHI